MRTIGLLGGMSWESSALYYRLINEEVQRRLGGLHSARALLLSVDFAEIEDLQASGKWEEAAAVLQGAARQLEAGGADFIALCTNTMHKVADGMMQGVNIPLLHIADTTGFKIKQRGVKKVGLLGTRFTMEQDFYRGRLEDEHALLVTTPDEKDREIVHRVIYDELCKGDVRVESRQQFERIIADFAEQECTGVILGCTEIGMLIKDAASPMQIFDTTRIHAVAAVDAALSQLKRTTGESDA